MPLWKWCGLPPLSNKAGKSHLTMRHLLPLWMRRWKFDLWSSQSPDTLHFDPLTPALAPHRPDVLREVQVSPRIYADLLKIRGRRARQRQWRGLADSFSI